SGEAPLHSGFCRIAICEGPVARLRQRREGSARRQHCYKHRILIAASVLGGGFLVAVGNGNGAHARDWAALAINQRRGVYFLEPEHHRLKAWSAHLVVPKLGQNVV